MKKVMGVLLVLLIVTSCFALTSCNYSKPICEDGCSFPFNEDGTRQRICEICGNTWCTVRNYHNWDGEGICSWCGKNKCEVEGIHAYDSAGVCVGCGAKICKTDGHTWNEETGECEYCNKTICKEEGHEYDRNTGICVYCEKSACKQGDHNFNTSTTCKWCEKTICQAEGHDYREGYCKNCDKVSIFAWVYDIFDEPIENPDKPMTEEEIEAQKKREEFWEAVGEGATIVAFMLGTTVIFSLITWVLAFLRWSKAIFVVGGLQVLVTIGMLLMYGWIWALVKFIIFDGLYFGLVLPLLLGRYGGHDNVF